VREDYSVDGNAWDYFTHDQARSRAYNWGEDGLAGISDDRQQLCFALALWNGRDPILKERLFGLSNREGNHGEDVKEYYFYLDNLPTHAYAKMLYKYPQIEFPYADLIAENARRGPHDPEYDLFDAIRGAVRDHRYFDVFVEYAKADAEDILCRIQVVNRGAEAAPIHVLPHLWYRNTWSWTHDANRAVLQSREHGVVETCHPSLGTRHWYVEAAAGAKTELLFTENDTNVTRLFGSVNASAFVKDGINDAVVCGRTDRANRRCGSKAAALCQALVSPGESFTVRIRWSPRMLPRPFARFDAIVDA